MHAELNLNSNGAERVAYQTASFPVRAVNSKLSAFQDYAAGCHWHPDLEFLLALEGDISYFVNGTIVQIRQGEAIFVNSGRLHYGFSPLKRECVFSCLLFHPSLAGEATLPARQYLSGLADGTQADYLLLSDRDAFGAQALALLKRIMDACRFAGPYYELDVQADCLMLVKTLCLSLAARQTEAAPDPAWEILRRMIGFLQEHYAEKIALAQIARAGAVCRSKCCALFGARLGVSPMIFLNRCRMEQACRMLRGSRLNVTEIASACGFTSPSYFAEQFRRAFSVSPSEFRKSDAPSIAEDAAPPDKRKRNRG